MKTTTINESHLLVGDTVPAVSEVNEKGYILRVQAINGKSTVVIKDKSGKEVKQLSLDEWMNDESRYEDLYGELEPAPVPVPPVPPLPPATPRPVKLPANVKSINVNNDKATVYLKNGTKESFDLSDPGQKTSFEKKYGPMPEPPVPPVPPTAPAAPAAPVKVTANVNTSVNSNNSVNINTTNSINASSNINAVAVVSPVAITNQTSTSTVITAASPVAIASGNVIAIAQDGHALTGEEEILVTITRKTTADQLEEFKKQMKEKGIELKFNEIDYDNGKLVKISGTMKSKDGKSKSNFSVTDFSKVILASITDGSKTYFKVNVVDNKRTVI